MKVRIYREGAGTSATVADASDRPIGALVATFADDRKCAGNIVVEPADEEARRRFAGAWDSDEDGYFMLYESTARTTYEVRRAYRGQSPVKTAT